jgi:hypothetical protein
MFDDEILKPLAREIYEAHRRSRQLKTEWKDLGGSEKQHWVDVATAVRAFMEEFESVPWSQSG